MSLSLRNGDVQKQTTILNIWLTPFPIIILFFINQGCIMKFEVSVDMSISQCFCSLLTISNNCRRLNFGIEVLTDNEGQVTPSSRNVFCIPGTLLISVQLNFFWVQLQTDLQEQDTMSTTIIRAQTSATCPHTP